MPLFSAYPESTSPDLDDSYLVLVDGVVSRVTGATTKAFTLPTGTVDANDYSTTAEVLLNACDATTGFVGSGGHAGVNTVDIFTSIAFQGTGCVHFLMDMDVVGSPVLYYLFPTAQTIGSRTHASFMFRYSTVGPAGFDLPQCVQGFVADGTGYAGNTQTVAIPSIPEDTWTLLTLPLAGLSAIKSVGIRRSVNTGVASSRADIFMDKIHLPAETKLDQALGSSTSTVVNVPPNYTPDANQTAVAIPDGKAVVDPALGVYSKANNVIQLHDILAHVVGAETGLTDVAGAVGVAINSAQPGQTVLGTPGAYYRFDHDVVASGLEGVTIDFTGCYLFLTYQSNTPFITLDDCRDVTLIRPMMFGYGPTTHTGANMENVAGTPTISGTTKLLDAASEEVQLLDSSNWDMPFHFARVLPQQVGVADDGLGPRNYFAVTLSDSAQVANDCIVTIYDGDTTTVLAQSTLTLTGTPTAYPISYFPADLGKRLRLTIKKATATANTITVTEAISQGRVNYTSTYDVASGIILTNAERVKIIEPWIESFGGDAIQISDVSVRDVLIIDPVSRGCRRQGYSFNRGQEITVVRPVARETGRSGIDIEPFSDTWFTKRIRIYDTKFYNITNYGFAMQNWARNFDVIIDGVDMYDTRLGVIFGGSTRGVFTNMRNWSDTGLGMSADFDFIGSNMAISNIRTKVRVQTHTNTNTYDDGTGVQTFTPTGNLVDSRSVTVAAGFGISWLTGWRDVNDNLFVAANTGAAYTATRTALRQDFLLTVTANTTITLAGGALLNNEVSVWNIVFKQDATGGRTIAVSGVTWPGGTPTFTTTALASNHCSFVQYGTGPTYGYYGGSAAT